MSNLSIAAQSMFSPIKLLADYEIDFRQRQKEEPFGSLNTAIMEKIVLLAVSLLAHAEAVTRTACLGFYMMKACFSEMAAIEIEEQKEKCTLAYRVSLYAFFSIFHQPTRLQLLGSPFNEIDSEDPPSPLEGGVLSPPARVRSLSNSSDSSEISLLANELVHSQNSDTIKQLKERLSDFERKESESRASSRSSFELIDHPEFEEFKHLMPRIREILKGIFLQNLRQKKEVKLENQNLQNQYGNFNEFQELEEIVKDLDKVPNPTLREFISKAIRGLELTEEIQMIYNEKGSGRSNSNSPHTSSGEEDDYHEARIRRGPI